MNNEIILKLDELIKEIKAWPEFLEISNLDKIINTKYKDLLNEFNLEKEKFNEVYEYGKYHPDYMDVVKSFGKVKENLYNKEEVKNYFLLTEQVREKLQLIVDEIAETISPLGFAKGGNVCVTIWSTYTTSSLCCYI